MTAKSPGLPAEYQEVEYLRSDNAISYIQTLITPNKTHKYEIKFIPVRGRWGFLFGGSKGNDTVGIYGGDEGGGTPSIFITPLSYNLYNNNTYSAILDIKNGVIIIDNEIVSSGEVSEFDTGIDYPIRLFCRNHPDYPNHGFGTIWYFKAYNNDIMSANFIPCYRKSDNKPGMYDLYGSICPLTNSPFYINAGTGEFTVGPDVN